VGVGGRRDEGGGLEEGERVSLRWRETSSIARIYFIYNIQIYSRRYSVVLHIKYMSGYIMHQIQFYSQ
jgi:hypothetical protein